MNPLHAIIGNQLSAVTFVQDYIQLAFDGPQLTAYIDPVVHIGGKTFTSGTPGYRDALCALIAKIVTGATVKEGEGIELVMGNAGRITISLQPEDYHRGPEAVNYTNGQPGEANGWWVW